ncbi:MAG: hypothetical protein OXU79_05360 [Gemmatimonadota bacterium]|nr:hypothetical protein [Gemmatimonadota bacterium]
MDEPLRVPDIHSHARRPGLPESHPEMPVNPKLARLVASICHREERVGTVFPVEKKGGREFITEDE